MGKSTGPFDLEIDGLIAGKVYYYQAYAENSGGLARGELLSFLVPQFVVITMDTKDITEDSAVVQGRVTGIGKITEAGFSLIPGNVGRITAVPDGDGYFSVKIEDLEAKTEYYFAAYAKVGDKEIMGKVLRFTRREDIPQVLTYEAVDITQILGSIGGHVIENKEHPITEAGFYWGPDPDPDIRVGFQPDDDEDTFFCRLVYLLADTTYYYKAYAVNEKGTGYGDILEFTTLVPVAPTVQTGSAVYDYENGFWGLAGTVVDNGGTHLDEYGFRFSTDGS